MFTDTHCHLYHEYYDDLDIVINNANNCDVNRLIVSGVDQKTNEEILKLNNHNVYLTIGIHPESIDNYKDSDLSYIKSHINDPRVIAVGEIGLDYHYDNTKKNEQKELLINQLKIAKEHHKPVIIHSREATQDTLDILSQFDVVGVIHSFSGSIEVAKKYIELGYLLGINGVVTFKNAHIKEVLKEVGINNIVLETDSPYLTPSPYRGEKNEPAHIHDIATFICEIVNIDLETLSTVTNENIKRIFDI